MSGAGLTEQAIATMARLAVEIADRAAITDIECETHPVKLDDSPHTWRDVRPMVDEREHAPESIDMAMRAIDYALLRHLAERHPQHQHLLRITRHP